MVTERLVFPAGRTVDLRLSVIDDIDVERNPVTELTVVASIRRLSDDSWWDWVAGEWDGDVVYGSLGDEHQKVMDDKGDGSYETSWDQLAADGGVEASYLVIYEVLSPPWTGRVQHDHLFFQSASGVSSSVLRVTVTNGTIPLSGAVVDLSLTEGGPSIREGVSDAGGLAVLAVPLGTYWLRVGLNGYSHTPQEVVVDEATEEVVVALSAINPEAPSDPAVCRCYAYMLDASGQPLDAEQGSMVVSRVHHNPDGFTGVVTPNGPVGTTDANGYVYIDVVRLTDVQITVTWGDRNRSKEYVRLVVPDAVLHNVGTLLHQML